MRRRKTTPERAEPTEEPEAAGFVHSSRQADLTALLAEYTLRSETGTAAPRGFRARSIGNAPPGERPAEPSPSELTPR